MKLSIRVRPQLSLEDLKEAFTSSCEWMTMAGALASMGALAAFYFFGTGVSLVAYAGGFGFTVLMLRLYVLASAGVSEFDMNEDDGEDRRTGEEVFRSAFWRCTPALLCAGVFLWIAAGVSSPDEALDGTLFQATARGMTVGSLTVMALTIKYLRLWLR